MICGGESDDVCSRMRTAENVIHREMEIGTLKNDDDVDYGDRGGGNDQKRTESRVHDVPENEISSMNGVHRSIVCDLMASAEVNLVTIYVSTPKTVNLAVLELAIDSGSGNDWAK